MPTASPPATSTASPCSSPASGISGISTSHSHAERGNARPHRSAVGPKTRRRASALAFPRGAWERVSTRMFMPAKQSHVEHVEMTGHIVDSLLLPKVLDAILTRGGRYHISEFQLGEKQDDPSRAKIEVRAESAAQLEAILAEIHPHGAVTANPKD